jgi:hypothetical protein
MWLFHKKHDFNTCLEEMEFISSVNHETENSQYEIYSFVTDLKGISSDFFIISSEIYILRL